MIDFFSLTQEKKDEMMKRFDSYIDKKSPTECWMWKGPIYPLGYGDFKISRDKRIVFRILAHRFAWMTRYNCPIPKGLYCMHSCDTPACVNPEHIALGTATQNNREKVLKDRSKLKPMAERLKIAEAVFKGYSVRTVAKMFNIASGSTVRAYVKMPEVVARYGNIDLTYRRQSGRRSATNPFPSLI